MAREGNEENWVPASEDAATESAVLQLVLELHPAQVAVADLLREIGGESPGFAESDAVDRAVRDLAAVGLLHRHDDFVLATRAALRFDQLLNS